MQLNNEKTFYGASHEPTIHWPEPKVTHHVQWYLFNRDTV